MISRSFLEWYAYTRTLYTYVDRYKPVYIATTYHDNFVSIFRWIRIRIRIRIHFDSSDPDPDPDPVLDATGSASLAVALIADRK